ncbi:MAG: SRPBCC family protein [Pseudomonadota bacterium]
MQKILIWIGGAVAALFALLVVVGLVLPQTVSASRSIEIAAAPEEVFPHLTDFNRFAAWSPWSERDPDMLNEVTGEPGRVGHTNSWSGDKTVGVGRQTIAEIRENEYVRMDLAFEGQGEATAWFDIEPTATGSTVTWSFETDLGANPFGKLMGPMISRFVGTDYEQGLANLKQVVETS